MLMADLPLPILTSAETWRFSQPPELGARTRGLPRQVGTLHGLALRKVRTAAPVPA